MWPGNCFIAGRMITTLRLSQIALLLTSLVPGVAYAQDAPSGKLDESLQQAVDAGCPGPQAVIIRTKPGYRQGLRDSLAAHGDVVSGEFASIDAVAATVHCDDLEVLASLNATATISYDAPMSATGRAGQGRARSRTGRVLTPREAVDKAAAARARVFKLAAAKAAKAAARKTRRSAVKAAALREQEAQAATELQAPLFQTLLGQPSLRTSGSVQPGCGGGSGGAAGGTPGSRRTGAGEDQRRAAGHRVCGP